MSDDTEIESIIQAEGLTTAPRITPEDIKALVVGEYYYNAAEGPVIQAEHYSILGRLTICVLVLKNGFTVVGESACVSSANYKESVGRELARRKAEEKIWALEGYLLTERLHQTYKSTLRISEMWKNP